MLFYYNAAAASDNNWLHNWFIESIDKSLDSIDTNTPVPSWEALTEGYVGELRARWALERDFFVLVDAYRNAEGPERGTARRAITEQNLIADACEGSMCLRAADLAKPIADAAVALGERLFNLLNELGIRERHYRQIWGSLGNNVCPFCALIELDDPSLPGEDLDHYLTRRVYPFAAANLHNLAPMCSRCNMDYKKEKDVLSAVGTERHYPYAANNPGGVELSGSVFFANGDDKPPAWRISLTPSSKEAEWDRIFEVKSRYQLSILNRRYTAWLEEWASILPIDVLDSDAAIIAALQRSSSDWSSRGLHDKAFLKASYLDLVRETLTLGDPTSAQLFAIIRSQIAMRKPAIAPEAA
ncbi:hypothetical protein GOD67_06920 [Sinorhizobium medicae]|nr:hypothetical protein [Sinorhizobium medicae]MDX0680135.1 hypothetical protein [Sinorhizobium medicae]MDX0712488.1 hypothetical protein [Sinorhizobium medicae]MDX0842411.1 hypothetical protein [Sinorhizobium medicae]